jgi:hypothetical protein
MPRSASCCRDIAKTACCMSRSAADADTRRGSRSDFRGAAARARRAMRAKRGRGGSLTASGRLFNLWIGKSRADLALLETDLPTGPYPFAGITVVLHDPSAATRSSRRCRRSGSTPRSRAAC